MFPYPFHELAKEQWGIDFGDKLAKKQWGIGFGDKLAQQESLVRPFGKLNDLAKEQWGIYFDALADELAKQQFFSSPFKQRLQNELAKLESASPGSVIGAFGNLVDTFNQPGGQTNFGDAARAIGGLIDIINSNQEMQAKAEDVPWGAIVPLALSLGR